jgi:hypothetical protein
LTETVGATMQGPGGGVTARPPEAGAGPTLPSGEPVTGPLAGPVVSMVAAAPALTAEVVARWRRSRVPPWLPKGVLPALWIVALSVLVAEAWSEVLICTVEEPCGPDPVDAGLVAVLLAVPLLLVRWPWVGCLSGAAVAVTVAAEGWVLQQPVVSAAFAVVAGACVLVAAGLDRARRGQRRLVRELAGPTAGPPADRGVELGLQRWDARRATMVALMVLLAIGALSRYGYQVRSERAAIARSVEVVAKVVDLDQASSTISLVVPAPGEPRDVEVGVFDARSYAEGQAVPVLLDPDEDDRVRLVAEPSDPTGWLVLAGLCLLLSMFGLVDEGRARRARRRLLTRPQPALRVRIAPAADGSVRVWEVASPGPSEEPAAQFPVVSDRTMAGCDGGSALLTTSAVGPVWAPGFTSSDRQEVRERGAWPRDALLAGDLRDGGWAMVVLDEGVLLPEAPLRVPRAPRRG